MKRFSLFSVAVLFSLVASSAFADPLYLSVNATPYDRQMTRIRPFLTANSNGASGDVSIALVNRWMANLRSIPYGFTMTWKTPEETESGAPADCKAKAVALYGKMQAAGAQNVRLVIGKRTSASVKTHAWLAWERDGSSYVLDPTFNSRAFTVKQAGKRNYQPLYAYAGAKKFRAANSTLVASN